MIRWMLTLECRHRLLSDERQVEGTEYCPRCAMSFPIIDCAEWFDAEASS